MYNPMDLTGKLVLVTGASSGIGRGVAVVLSRLGARLILTGRRPDALDETLNLLEQREIHLAVPFDLGETDRVSAWVKEAVSSAGAPLHGLVHAAGVSAFVPIRGLSGKVLDSVMVPNLNAAIALLRGASARGVVSETGASFVMISSVSGLVGEPGLVAYSASKGALTAAARSAALELAPKRIRVNCVAPGYVETPMLDQARDLLSAENYEAVVQKHPLGIGRVEDVGHSVAYLLSDAARWVTGTTMVVDGGYTA